ncbi:uncharacterized protein ACIQIH_017842 [Cyanocitta cristata]
MPVEFILKPLPLDSRGVLGENFSFSPPRSWPGMRGKGGRNSCPAHRPWLLFPPGEAHLENAGKPRAPEAAKARGIPLKIRGSLLKSPHSFGFRGRPSKRSIPPEQLLSQGIGNLGKGAPKLRSGRSGPLLPHPGSDPDTPERSRHPRVTLTSQSDSDTPGLIPTSQSDPDIPGVIPTSQSDSDTPGLIPTSQSDPDIPERSRHPRTDPDIPGLLPTYWRDPDTPGLIPTSQERSRHSGLIPTSQSDPDTPERSRHPRAIPIPRSNPDFPAFLLPAPPAGYSRAWSLQIPWERAGGLFLGSSLIFEGSGGGEDFFWSQLPGTSQGWRWGGVSPSVPSP